MTIEEIKNKLVVIMNDYIDVDPNTVDLDMSFNSDLGIDSFGVISMINAIEKEFEIDIPEYELTSFQTLRDMVTYIERKQN